MTAVVAGVDIGNATTEVAVLAGGWLLGTDRLPTRGRKGSAESVHGAAALVRRAERRLGVQVTEASIAPLRAVDTATLAVPALPPRTGRLRVLAAGVPTPGGAGTCVGQPLALDAPDPAAGPRIVLVPPGLGYAAAAAQVRRLIDTGVPVGAVLAAGDEGVLIANRLAAPVPVIDQVDTVAAAACPLLAVEVRAPGQPLTMLTDPVALGAALRLGDGEAADAVTLSRLLLDYSNAVIGLARPAPGTGPALGLLLSHGCSPRAAGSRSARRAPSWPAGRPALSARSAPRPAKRRWTTCMHWTWPWSRTAPRPAGAAPGGPCWPRRCTGPGPARTTRRCSASCSADRCTA